MKFSVFFVLLVFLVLGVLGILGILRIQDTHLLGIRDMLGVKEK